MLGWVRKWCGWMKVVRVMMLNRLKSQMQLKQFYNTKLLYKPNDPWTDTPLITSIVKGTCMCNIIHIKVIDPRQASEHKDAPSWFTHIQKTIKDRARIVSVDAARTNIMKAAQRRRCCLQLSWLPDGCYSKKRCCCADMSVWVRQEKRHSYVMSREQFVEHLAGGFLYSEDVKPVDPSIVLIH